jgi:hypothetical protein
MFYIIAANSNFKPKYQARAFSKFTNEDSIKSFLSQLLYCTLNKTRFWAEYYSVIPDVSSSLIKVSSARNIERNIVTYTSKLSRQIQILNRNIKHVHSQNSRMKIVNISFQNCSIIHKT